MIKASYTLNARELATIRKLNRLSHASQWVVGMVLTACFLPGVLVGWLLGDMLALLIVAAMMVLFVVALMIGIFQRTGNTAQHEKEVTFNEHFRSELTANSTHQMLLSDINDWRETADHFVLVRFGMAILEPKRVYSDEQQAELRRLLDRRHQTATDLPASERSSATDDPASGSTKPAPLEPVFVPLYDEILNNQSLLYRASFRYQRTDFDRAQRSGYQLVSEESLQPESKTTTWRTRLASIFLIVLSIGSALFWMSRYPMISFRVLACVGLSAGLVYLAIRWFRIRDQNSLDRLSDELFDRTLEFGLSEQGWFCGSPISATFHRWQDVDNFSENASSWLITTLGTHHLIPKRIFGEDGAADQAIQTALRLRKNALLREEWSQQTAVTAVESGNPFQSPRTPE